MPQALIALSLLLATSALHNSHSEFTQRQGAQTIRKVITSSGSAANDVDDTPPRAAFGKNSTVVVGLTSDGEFSSVTPRTATMSSASTPPRMPLSALHEVAAALDSEADLQRMLADVLHANALDFNATLAVSKVEKVTGDGQESMLCEDNWKGEDGFNVCDIWRNNGRHFLNIVCDPNYRERANTYAMIQTKCPKTCSLVHDGYCTMEADVHGNGDDPCYRAVFILGRGRGKTWGEQHLNAMTRKVDVEHVCKERCLKEEHCKYLYVVFGNGNAENWCQGCTKPSPPPGDRCWNCGNPHSYAYEKVLAPQ